jgi:hypothetical protein
LLPVDYGIRYPLKAYATTFLAGVGMPAFGEFPELGLGDMGRAAALGALRDADLRPLEGLHRHRRTFRGSGASRARHRQKLIP